MEKNIGFASGVTQPSGPPSSAPPTYEEAVENAARVSRQPNAPPYPVGPAVMPVPTFNQLPNQTTMPYAPPYLGPSEPPLQSQTQYTAIPNTAPTSHVQIVCQPVIHSLGPSPMKTTCPTCHANIKTTTTSDHQPSAHLCCIALCLLGCCLCSCLPYCMDSFRSVHHFCPACKGYIGTWKC
ncbi:lipopolysaccharide-induced tumor necrosis factor-alpha factor [Xylocopa sonorina]|uniref:lipopolysaccharide-induced tumor necrosis factor-alpha factor n=1 Tax=Xylocopa sonorina TaxID=1818115 RepID=UPI00403AA41F